MMSLFISSDSPSTQSLGLLMYLSRVADHFLICPEVPGVPPPSSFPIASRISFPKLQLSIMVLDLLLYPKDSRSPLEQELESYCWDTSFYSKHPITLSNSLMSLTYLPLTSSNSLIFHSKSHLSLLELNQMISISFYSLLLFSLNSQFSLLSSQFSPQQYWILLLIICWFSSNSFILRERVDLVFSLHSTSYSSLWIWEWQQVSMFSQIEPQVGNVLNYQSLEGYSFQVVLTMVRQEILAVRICLQKYYNLITPIRLSRSLVLLIPLEYSS